MYNQITVSGTVLLLDEEKKNVYIRVDGFHQASLPLLCKAEGISIEGIEVGDHLLLSGYFKSRDICYPNPCDCNTITTGIETYLVFTSYEITEEIQNKVRISGISVKTPKQIQTSNCSFLSLRLRLQDGNGFLTSTVDTVECIENCQVGQEIQLQGILKTKDYQKHLHCPCCGKEAVHPCLSLWVRTRMVEAKGEDL